MQLPQVIRSSRDIAQGRLCEDGGQDVRYCNVAASRCSKSNDFARHASRESWLQALRSGNYIA